ncbi:MAG: DUF4405 domain-containing protein [Candidatus Magasanikbacteria bacterium]|nr:DUF4405 domain-containing protein [Candidatus Magasanikbacteria bacterium]
MKKLILSIILLFIPFFTQAQTCPFGLENDPAPGQCGNFIDENKNTLCDLSEVPLDIRTSEAGEPAVEYVSGEELKQNTVAEVAKMYEIDAVAYAQKLSEYTKKEIKTGDSLQTLHDNYGLCSGVAGGIALDLKNQTLEKTVVADTEKVGAQVQEKNGKELYNFVPVTLVLIVLYLLTFFLSKKNKISKFTHRRIWNVALLISFLVSALLGLLLVIRINYGWMLNLPFNTTYVHVESGIIMAVISVFHIIWHWQYYACLIKKSKKCETTELK